MPNFLCNECFIFYEVFILHSKLSAEIFCMFRSVMFFVFCYSLRQMVFFKYSDLKYFFSLILVDKLAYVCSVAKTFSDALKALCVCESFDCSELTASECPEHLELICSATFIF